MYLALQVKMLMDWNRHYFGGRFMKVISKVLLLSLKLICLYFFSIFLYSFYLIAFTFFHFFKIFVFIITFLDHQAA